MLKLNAYFCAQKFAELEKKSPELWKFQRKNMGFFPFVKFLRFEKKNALL